jgi:hypothetical protein
MNKNEAKPMNPTPGPYPLTVTKLADFFVIVTNQGNHFAKAFDPCAARLISAAPEMLAALELIYSNAGESPEWIRARIGPVIEKAIGESESLARKIREKGNQ